MAQFKATIPVVGDLQALEAALLDLTHRKIQTRPDYRVTWTVVESYRDLHIHTLETKEVVCPR
jgi:hypothetical protein